MKRRDFLKTVGIASAGAALFEIPSFGKDTLAPNEKLDKASEKIKRLEGLNGEIRSLSPLIGDKKLTCVIVGCGNRGRAYEKYIMTLSDKIKVVAVSDINEYRKNWMADRWDIPAGKRFGDYHEILAQPKLADMMLICLPDALHYEPAMKAMALGYDVLLEKPLAQSEKECLNLLAQSKKYDKILGTCHVLRYAPYFIALRAAVKKGLIGELVSIQHLEPIAFDHIAHSYVRGIWHNSKETTPIILAKSCHDLDIIKWIVGKPCTSVSAEGDLRFFKKENAPEGAPMRCTDGCPHESTCPYSAIEHYVRRRTRLNVFDLDKKCPEEDILNKLRTTDYGRCVFHCNNDQPDHYIANLSFEGGVTAAFSMEGFTPWGGRRTRLMGTKGFIEGDGKTFTLWDFRSNKTSKWEMKVEELEEYKDAGHGGGDWALVRDFFEAVAAHDPDKLTSRIDESVESHLMGFRCEVSRLTGKKVKM